MRHSKDGTWQALGTLDDFIATGRMTVRGQPLPSNLRLRSLLSATSESLGPILASTFQGRWSGSPGRDNSTFKEEKNQFPYASICVTRIAGPAETGFRWIEKGRPGAGKVQASSDLRKRSTTESPHKKT
jgi:hypothetical protein